MALKQITIYTEDKGDRNCPHCQSKEDLTLFAPVLKHNRTEMDLGGSCPDCGCNFIFRYVLFVSDIIYD